MHPPPRQRSTVTLESVIWICRGCRIARLLRRSERRARRQVAKQTKQEGVQDIQARFNSVRCWVPVHAMSAMSYWSCCCGRGSEDCCISAQYETQGGRCQPFFSYGRGWPAQVSLSLMYGWQPSTP